MKGCKALATWHIQGAGIQNLSADTTAHDLAAAKEPLSRANAKTSTQLSDT